MSDNKMDELSHEDWFRRYQGEANLVKWIEYALSQKPEEKIEAVIIGENQERVDPEGLPSGKLISWAEAKPWLDYDFDCGFGCADCHAIYVWTNLRVFFIAEYDGSTRLASVPRHPENIMPLMA